MEYSELKEKERIFLQNYLPNKLIKMDELKAVGDNAFELDGVQMSVSDAFVEGYDKIINLRRAQTKKVRKADGENGLGFFRNYLNMVDERVQSRQALVYASALNKELTDIVILKKGYITPQMFFDLIDMLLEELEMEPYEFLAGSISKGGITVSMIDANAPVSTFGIGEYFNTKGIYLQWSPSEVTLGHYYIRLVCTNGMTVIDNIKEDTYTSLDEDRVRELVKMIKDGQFFEQGIAYFEHLLKSSQISRLSIAEMKMLKDRLIKIGLSGDAAEQLVPYNEEVKCYQDKEYYSPALEHRMIGNETAWDICNRLTDFATHSDILPPDDVCRHELRNEAFKLLKRKPDIINYYDEFF